MAITFGPNLGLAVNGVAGEPHYTQLMAQWRGLDGLVQCVVKSATTSAQPASPANGDMYALPASPTGTNWSGQGNKLARYSTEAAAWEFYTAKNGWECVAQDTGHKMRFNGTNWAFLEGYGTTANRPTYARITGAMYFDTTISKPVWYTGAGWVDATGTAA